MSKALNKQTHLIEIKKLYLNKQFIEGTSHFLFFLFARGRNNLNYNLMFFNEKKKTSTRE